MTVKQMEIKLDDLCRDIVFRRDKGCLICQDLDLTTKSELQPAHVFSRDFKSIRWNSLNIGTVCKRHHMFGIHNNRALTEHLYQAYWKARYPERFAIIIAKKKKMLDTFEGYENKLIEIKRELEAQYE